MHRPSRSYREAGPLERKHIVEEHGATQAIEERDLRETAEEENAAGDACIEELYEDAPRSAWKFPFFVSLLCFTIVLAATMWAAWFFNGQTLNLPPAAAVTVGLGLPLAIFGMKSALGSFHIGRIPELLKAAEKAQRGLRVAAFVAIPAFIVYGLARTVGALDDSITLLGLMALELALGLAAAELFTLTLIHGRAPLHFYTARRSERAAAERAPFVGAPESGGDEPDDGAPPSRTTKPIHRPAASPSANGSRTNTGAAAGLVGTALIIATTLTLATNSYANIDAKTVAYYIDCTPSVAGSPELSDAAGYAASSLPDILELAPAVRTVELYLWRGDATSSRVASRRWELPLIPPRDSTGLFRRRQEYLRQEALRRRAPLLAEPMRVIASAGVEPAARTRQSCMWALLDDARASRALCLIVTDAADEACRDRLLSRVGVGRVLIIVIARRADGALAQALVESRVRHLRAAGFNAVNARELRGLDWAQLLGARQGGASKPSLN